MAKKIFNSEAYLKSILDNIVDGLVTIDESGLIQSVNKAAERIFGYSFAELVGHDIKVLMPEPYASEHAGYMESYLKGGEARVIGIGREVVGRRRDGSEFPLHLGVSEMWHEGRRFFSGIVRDLTDQKAKEEMLDSLDKFNRLILDSAGEGIYGLGLDGKTTFVNPAAARMLGYSPEELIGLHSHDVFHHSYSDGRPFPVEECKIISALETGNGSRISGEIFWRKNGTGFPVEYTVTPIQENGAILGAVVTFRDIFIRKRTEEALEKSEAMHRAFFNNAGVPLSVIDDGLRFFQFNQIWCDLLEMSPEELRDKTPMDLIHSEDRSRFAEQLSQVQAGKLEAFRMAIRIFSKSGTLIWLDWSLSAMRDPGGQIFSYICITPDITLQKNAEREILGAHDEAVRASEAKTHFLSRMSHELRTPLNAILGFGQLLSLDQQGTLTSNQKAGIAEILKAGKHLLELINDVLELSRIEVGDEQTRIETVDLGQLIRDMTLLVAPLADPMKVDIGFENRLPTKLTLACKAKLLKMILLNLMTNGVKYNRPGGNVKIVAEREGNIVRIVVEDSGIGIAPENLESVFEPFNRIGAEDSEIEGTGIGLSITRKAVQDMGGVIWVESKYQKGSRFVVELPYESPEEGTGLDLDPFHALQAETEPLPEKAELNSQQRTVLYIEDNVPNQELIRNLFAHATPHELQIASNAEEGLEMARTLLPDLILLDIHMPGKNGFEVKRDLEALESTRSIPVIGLSAHALQEYRDQALQAGFQAYITKPINIQEFLSVLNACLNEGRPV